MVWLRYHQDGTVADIYVWKLYFYPVSTTFRL